MGVDGVGGEEWRLEGSPDPSSPQEWSREALLLSAIRDIEEALEGDQGGKAIAQRDRISAIKSILDLKMQVLAAREAAREDEAAATTHRDQAARIRAMGAALRDERAENRDLKARIEALEETQRAWGKTAGT